jgi:hypothetical protein
MSDLGSFFFFVIVFGRRWVARCRWYLELVLIHAIPCYYLDDGKYGHYEDALDELAKHTHNVIDHRAGPGEED